MTGRLHPTGAISSYSYTPQQTMLALRHFIAIWARSSGTFMVFATRSINSRTGAPESQWD